MAMVVSVLLFAALLSAAPVVKYASVAVDDQGNVNIVTEDGQRITPPKDGDQVGAERAAVAPDHDSVGWLALYPFCCTSYPLPLKLVIVGNGQLRMLKGEFGEPIWFWMFQNEGKVVAFKEETPHGNMGLHYELWDVTKGERVADYTPEYDENGRVVARPNEPEWVRSLDAEHDAAQKRRQ